MGGQGRTVTSRSGRRQLPIGAATGRQLDAFPIATRRAVQQVSTRGRTRGRGGNLPAIARTREGGPVSRAARRRARRAIGR